MSRPNSHSITKATDFVKGLFKKDDSEKVYTTQEETEPAQTLTLSARESLKDKEISDKYHRADTTVGVMNKFILQFSRVEQVCIHTFIYSYIFSIILIKLKLTLSFVVILFNIYWYDNGWKFK